MNYEYDPATGLRTRLFTGTTGSYAGDQADPVNDFRYAYDAFQRLTQRDLEAGYRLARVILGDRADAEDAVHDACLLAWQKWSTLRDEAAFERWFQRILVVLFVLLAIGAWSHLVRGLFF